MKRKIVVGLMTCMVLLSACAKPTATEEMQNTEQEPVVTEEATGISSDDLIAKAVAAAGADAGEVLDSQVSDFDEDGADEAFVFIGGEVDAEWSVCSGTVYFVDGDTCEAVMENDAFYAAEGANVIDTIETGERTFIHLREAYATSLVSYLYYVEDNQVKESAISGIGNFFQPDYVDSYGISISAYDGMVDYEAGAEDEGMYTGHTWKHYYFHYDAAAGDFAEYVGSPITDSDLAECVGFDLAGEIRNSGYEVGDIYRRDNGIVNVNYSKTTENDGAINVEYHNATYNINTKKYADPWDAGTNTWEDSDFGGTYLAGITSR